jgi:DNA ligase-1
MRGRLPVAAFLFDCLYLDGESLIDRSTAERIAALSGAVPVELRMPQASTGDRAEAEAFAAAALAAGHEGIMAKALDAPYEAGNRGKSWLKIKRAHTLDLVILAAEWGHGRRQGWLSNLHLGARDPEKGGFVMLGKTFKGLTDGMLEWQTRRLLELELARDDWTVYVRPDLVVEIAFIDVQASPRYPAGLALRLARVKRYRTDKPAAEGDTIATVRQIFERQAGELGDSA